MNPLSCCRRSVLRAASFRAYLVARRSQVVGRSGREDGCPIANWLSHVVGLPCEVTCDGYQFPDSDTLHPVPAWVQAFIRGVDFSFFGELTGEQALSLLDSIERQSLGNGPARPLAQLVPYDVVQQSGPIGGKLL